MTCWDAKTQSGGGVAPTGKGHLAAHQLSLIVPDVVSIPTITQNANRRRALGVINPNLLSFCRWENQGQRGNTIHLGSSRITEKLGLQIPSQLFFSLGVAVSLENMHKWSFSTERKSSCNNPWYRLCRQSLSVLIQPTDKLGDHSKALNFSGL